MAMSCVAEAKATSNAPVDGNDPGPAPQKGSPSMRDHHDGRADRQRDNADLRHQHPAAPLAEQRQ
jgi:hypothetical protein